MPVDYTFVSPEAPGPTYDLSVITVCRNDFVGLQATMRSVLRQKAKGSLRIEHIVVDGLSEDATPQWLQEQHEAGHIEVFVSEPDRGIYDAMNKGINMARGRVLAFLNAADSYTEADLGLCIAPILAGETPHTVATARLIDAKSGELRLKQSYKDENSLLTTPCCHQAYFATAAAYRRHGGYRARQFRCCADGFFINTLTKECGAPSVIACDIANFAIGGFSDACGVKFLHEFIDMQWHFHDAAMQRAVKDARYARALAYQQLQHLKLIVSEKTPSEAHSAGRGELLHTMSNDMQQLPIPPFVKRQIRRLECSRQENIASDAASAEVIFCEQYLTRANASYVLAAFYTLRKVVSAQLRHLFCAKSN